VDLKIALVKVRAPVAHEAICLSFGLCRRGS
jgi:hypothetical protein